MDDNHKFLKKIDYHFQHLILIKEIIVNIKEKLPRKLNLQKKIKKELLFLAVTAKNPNA